MPRRLVGAFLPGSFALFMVLTALVAGCALSQPVKPLETVSRVELDRYLGRWYEVARLPASFQEGCADSTADYSQLPDGRVKVVNRCVRNGNVDEAVGKAKIVDPASGSKLEVTFFWPFYGDYWILELGGEYEYSAVGEPSRKYLWILSRTPTMEKGKLSAIVERMGQKGFDTSRLIYNAKD